MVSDEVLKKEAIKKREALLKEIGIFMKQFTDGEISQIGSSFDGESDVKYAKKFMAEVSDPKYDLAVAVKELDIRINALIYAFANIITSRDQTLINEVERMG